MNDALLDAIVAAPDDDAPRLVWADRAGGERGELVILQCALAGEGLAPAERKRLADRAERILQRLDVWELEPFITPVFVRGFVEEVSATLADLIKHLARLLEVAPLIRSLNIRDVAEPVDPDRSRTAEDAWRAAEAKLHWVFDRWPVGRIRSLTLAPHVQHSRMRHDPRGSTIVRKDFGDAFLELVAAKPSLRNLRELVMPSTVLTRGSLPALLRLPELERLVTRAGGDVLLAEAQSLRP